MEYLWERIREQVTSDSNSTPTNFLPTAFSDAGDNESTPLSPGSSVASAGGTQTLDSKLKSLILSLYSENTASLNRPARTIRARPELLDSFGSKDPLTGNPVFPPQMISTPVRQKVMSYLNTMDYPPDASEQTRPTAQPNHHSFVEDRPNSVSVSQMHYAHRDSNNTGISRFGSDTNLKRPASAHLPAPLPVPGYARPVSVTVSQHNTTGGNSSASTHLLNHDMSSPFCTVVSEGVSTATTSLSSVVNSTENLTSGYHSVEGRLNSKVFGDPSHTTLPHSSTSIDAHLLDHSTGAMYSSVPVREAGRVPPLVYSPQQSVQDDTVTLTDDDNSTIGKFSPMPSHEKETDHNETGMTVPRHMLLSMHMPNDDRVVNHERVTTRFDGQEDDTLLSGKLSPADNRSHSTGIPEYLLQRTRSDRLESLTREPVNQPMIESMSTIHTTSHWAPINSNIQLPDKDYVDGDFGGTTRADNLEKELQEALQSKARLEGELEAVVSECESVLKDRVDLQAKLARAEAELASLQAPSNQKSLKVKEQNEEAILSLNNELQTVLDRLDKELANAESLQENLVKEQQLNGQLKNDLLSNRQTIQQREAAIEELHDKLSTVTYELGYKKDEVSQLQIQVSTLQNSLETLEESKRWLHKQLQEAIQARVSFQEELRESKATTIAQSVQVEQLKKQNVFYQQQVSEMQQGIFRDKARLVSELEEIQVNVRSQEDSYEMLVTKKSQLEDQVEMKNSECEDLNAKIKELSSSLATAQLGLQEAAEKQKSLESTVEILKQEKASLKLHVADSDACIMASNSALKDWDQAKTVLQGKVTNLERSLKSKDNTIAALTDANGLLEKELENGQETIQKLGNEVIELKDQLMTMEEECRRVQEESSEKDKKMSSLSSVQSTLSSDTQQMRMQLAQKEEMLMSKSIQVQSMEMQLKDLTKQMKSLQTMYEEFTQSGVELQASVSERDSALSQLNTTNQQLENKLAINEAELRELKATLLKAEQQKVNLEGQLETVSQANTEEFQQLLRDKSQLQAELNTTKVNHQHECLKLQAKITSLEADLKFVKKDVSKGEKQLRKEFDNRERQIKERETQIQNLESVITQLNAELNSVRNSKRALGNDVADKHEMVQVLLSQKDALQREKQTLAAQLQHEIAKTEKAEATLKVEVSTIKRACDEKERKLEAQVKELMLELERHRGKLAGINTTQLCIRNHAGVLEAALAQRESSLVKLSAQTKMVLAEKEAEDQAFTNRISSLEHQLDSLKAELQSSRQQSLVEKKRTELLKNELQQKEMELNDLRLQQDGNNSKSKELKRKCTQLQDSKYHLDAEIATLRSQISTERSSLDTAQKILAERDKQLEILNKELSISRLQLAEVKEEGRKAKEHSRIMEERQTMELDSMRQALDKSFANQEPPLRDELITKVNTSHSRSEDNSQADSMDAPSISISIQTR